MGQRHKDSWTPERRQQAAQASRASWANPKVRRKRVRGMKHHYKTTPLRRRQQSKRAKDLWANEDKRAQMKAGISAAHSKPETVEHKSRVMVKVWKRRGYRKRTVKAQRRGARRPEARRRKSEATKRLWNERKAKLAEAERILSIEKAAADAKAKEEAARRAAIFAEHDRLVYVEGKTRREAAQILIPEEYAADPDKAMERLRRGAAYQRKKHNTPPGK